MMGLRPWRVLMVMVVLFAPGLAGAESRPDPIAFARENVNEAIEKLTAQAIPESVRYERMLDILDSTFDVEAVSRFVLGPYARQASAEQFSRFKMLYRQYVAFNYAGMFRRYPNVDVNFEDATPVHGDVVVSGTIRPENAQPVAMKIQLRPREGAFRAVDLHVEGVSMPLSHRKQFAAAIRRHGGQLEGFIEELAGAVKRLRG